MTNDEICEYIGGIADYARTVHEIASDETITQKRHREAMYGSLERIESGLRRFIEMVRAQ